MVDLSIGWLKAPDGQRDPRIDPSCGDRIRFIKGSIDRQFLVHYVTREYVGGMLWNTVDMPKDKYVPIPAARIRVTLDDYRREAKEALFLAQPTEAKS